VSDNTGHAVDDFNGRTRFAFGSQAEIAAFPDKESAARRQVASRRFGTDPERLLMEFPLFMLLFLL
jgi:hypothetical protein